MSASRVAGGDIYPSRFVKPDTAIGKVVACGANENISGITMPGSRRAPWEPLQDTKLAIAGENVAIYDDPTDKDVMLELGGTVANGDYIKSDASGKGVAATANLDRVGARAKAGGVSGDIIPVDYIRIDLSL